MLVILVSSHTCTNVGFFVIGNEKKDGKSGSKTFSTLCDIVFGFWGFQSIQK